MSYTDEERAALANKLDNDLDNFIAQQVERSEKKKKESVQSEQTLDELVEVMIECRL